jgi:ABC-type multidrug transport system ATPase subunit
LEIIIDNLGKRYNQDWIFKGLSASFAKNDYTSILGNNGSGKSTLLQTISTYLLPSSGNILHKNNNKEIPAEDVVKHMSIATPYLELFEEFTALECIQFQAQFKPFIDKLNSDEILLLIDLKKAKNKPVKYFSSGMKQRLKLGLAILADTPLLLLDEPCSNLDKAGAEWYGKLMDTFKKNRLVFVCSNHQENEYYFCNKELNILNYK